MGNSIPTTQERDEEVRSLTAEVAGLKATLRGLPPTVAAGMISRLGERAQRAEAEVARLTQTRDALVDAVAPLVARVHEDGVDAPYPEREWAPLLTKIATLVRSMA